ncbi:hypothetical protein ACFL35_05610 [Candidatus Riflebacteria bacterium]
MLISSFQVLATRSKRCGNAFVAAIFISGILMVFGTIFLSFGMNTKNIVRSAYLDQIATFLAEAGAREVEVQIRNAIADEVNPKSVWGQLFKSSGSLTIPIKSNTLYATQSLIADSNINFIGGGRFSVTAEVKFAHIDKTKSTSNPLYPYSKPKERTGHVTIFVYPEYEFKKKKGKGPKVMKWKLVTSLDFRVVNVFSEVNRSKGDPFIANPTNDHVLWVKSAGRQNALTDGEVMHPYGGGKIVIDGVKAGTTRLLMGSGYGFEDRYTGSVRNEDFKNLDHAPLYINVPWLGNKVPPEPSSGMKSKLKNPRKSGGRVLLKGTPYFSAEKKRYVDAEINDMKQTKSGLEKQIEPKASEVKAELVKSVNDAYNKIKKEIKSKYGSLVWKKAKSKVEAKKKKGLAEADRVYNKMKSQWPGELSAAANMCKTKIETLYRDLYTCPIDVHYKNLSVFGPGGVANDDPPKKVYEDLMAEAFKFAKSKVPGSRQGLWETRWKDEWNKQARVFTSNMKGYGADARAMFGNGTFHRRAPLEFRSLQEKNMAGNFRKRFFGVRVMVWNTAKVASKRMSQPSKTVSPIIFKWESTNKKVYPTSKSFFQHLAEPTTKNVNGRVPKWLDNRWDTPVSLFHPYSPGSANQYFFKCPDIGVKEILDEVFSANSRKGSRRRRDQTIYGTSFNTDYKFRFSGMDSNERDRGFRGTRNYNYFQPWKITKSSKRWRRLRSYYFENEKDFKESNYYDEKGEEIYLKGLMWVHKGLTLSKNFTFYGRGILMVTGDIVIEGDLKTASNDDYCILFAKGFQGKVSDIIIKKGTIKGISLMALNQDYEDRNLATCSTIRTTGCELVLEGNYVADAVGWAGGLANGKPTWKKAFSARIKYDPDFYTPNGVYSSTMAGRFNEWVFKRTN